MRHWHVRRHDESDEYIFTTPDPADAFDCAAEELTRLAEHEYECITANGQMGAFEEAYRCFVRAETWMNLAFNAQNIYIQSTVTESKRAPLYRGAGWKERLSKSAEWVQGMINRDGPRGFVMHSCNDDECPALVLDD